MRLLFSLAIWVGGGLLLTGLLAGVLQGWLAPPQQTVETYLPPKPPPLYAPPRSDTADYGSDAARLSWHRE
jgi:hypothetical protein